MPNANISIAAIKCGNHYDSRNGNHNNMPLTDGDDIEVVLADNRRFGFRTRCNEHTIVTRIDTPIKFVGKIKNITWEQLNKAVKTELFHELFPKGSEKELNIFVFGTIQGEEKNRIITWANSHMVHTREITIRLRDELGEFITVKQLKSYSHCAETGDWNYVYLIDGKWQVTVTTNNYSGGGFHDSYRIEDYKKILAKKKAFGRRIKWISKKAGVPWNIGVFVGHIKNEGEAIFLLKKIRFAKESVDESLRWKLAGDITDRTIAFETLLGNAWKKIKCSGYRQTKILADYLLGDK